MVSQIGFNDFNSSYWYMPNGLNTAAQTHVQHTTPRGLPRDTVEISGKKNGNAKKVLAGLGIAAAIGGVIYCVATGKFSRAKQLAEHIEFKPAQTMEDAIKFAKKNLGVKLELEQDLHMANYINESLVIINNAMHGKSVMPKSVNYKSIKSCDGLEGFMGWGFGKGQINLGDLAKKFAKIMQKENMTMYDLCQYFSDVGASKQYIASVLGSFYHEMGHANHSAFCKDAAKMGRLGELKARKIKDTHYTEEFLKEVKDNKIVQDFFGGKNAYAFTSPAEYVAEVFRSKFVPIDNLKVPEEVQRIYYKYGGPKIDF